MITKQDKEQIIEVIGSYYSAIILKHLNEKGLKNKYGMPYTSRSTIINVMNGQTHKAIEKAILDVYQKTKKKNEIEVKRKQKLLKKKLA